MEAIMTFINVLVIPYISCIIRFKRLSKEIEFNCELLNSFIPYIGCNIIFSHVILYVAGSLFGIGVEIYSWVYSAAAILSACIMPILQEIIQKYFEVKVEITSRDVSERQKK